MLRGVEGVWEVERGECAYLRCVAGEVLWDRMSVWEVSCVVLCVCVLCVVL